MNTVSFGVYNNAEDIQSLRPSKIPKAIDILFGEYGFELEDNPEEWKGRVVAKIQDPIAYLQNKTDILQALKIRWADWKIKNRTEFKVIKECDQKLASCETILEIMKSVL